MVLIGAINVIILFLVCERLVDFRTAFLAGTLMAVSPLVVFNSRLTKEENLVQLFWLVGLFLYLKLVKTKDTPRLDYVCGAVLGLAALSKVHGGALGFAFAAAALAEKRPNPRRAARILGTSLGVSALYPLYGLILDGQTYLRVVTWLGQRYAIEDAADKFLILPRFILEPNVAAGTHLVDGWILLGWLSLLYLRRQKPISISLVAYLLILMATIHSGNLYGFYVIPVFPFLCLAAAVHIRRVLDHQTILPVFLFVALFFLPIFGRFSDMIPFGSRGLLVLSCLPLATSLLHQRGWKWAKVLEAFMLRAMLVLGVLAALHRCLTTL
jgi:4-amino-4-deoxy-L-arabinose transferase-like glycosyltransferase